MDLLVETLIYFIYFQKCHYKIIKLIVYRFDDYNDMNKRLKHKQKIKLH